MTSPEVQIQRSAIAVQEALEATYENAVMLNQTPDRIEALKAEPFLTPEAAMPVLVAELASALAAERRTRQGQGVALGELYDRVEALEKAEDAGKTDAKK